MKAINASRSWLRASRKINKQNTATTTVTDDTDNNAPGESIFSSSNTSPSSAVQAAAAGGVNLADAATEIYRDVGRTFPSHPFFVRPIISTSGSTTSNVSTVTAGGSISRKLDPGDNTQIEIHEDTTPGLSMLLTVLLGFVCSRPTVSYCQGMNYVAAVLLISTPSKHHPHSQQSPTNSSKARFPTSPFSPSSTVSSSASGSTPSVIVFDEVRCIRALALLLSLNDNYNLSDIWSPTLPRIKVLGYILSELTKRNAPLLHEYLSRLDMDIEIFATQWLLPLFSTTIPLQTLVVVWDLFFARGWKALFRIAVTLLVTIEPYILTLDLGGVAMFLRTWKDVVGQCYNNHEEECNSSPLIQTLLEECPALSILFKPTKLLEASSRIKVTRRHLRELEDLYAHRLIEKKAKAYVQMGVSTSTVNATVPSATPSSTAAASITRNTGTTVSQASSELLNGNNSSPSSATTTASPSTTRSRAVSSFASPSHTDVSSVVSSQSVVAIPTVSPTKPPPTPSNAVPTSSTTVTTSAPSTNPSIDMYELRDILSRPLLVPMYVLMHEDTDSNATFSFSSSISRRKDYNSTCTFSRLPSVAASKAARALRKAVVSATSKSSKNHHHHHHHHHSTHLFLHDNSHDGIASLNSSNPTSPHTPRSRTSTAASPFGSSTTLVNPSTRSLHSGVISPSEPLSLSTSSSSLALHSPRSRSASTASSINPNPLSGSNTTAGGMYSSSSISSRRNSFLHSVPTRNVLARSYSSSTKTDSYLDTLENIVASSSPLLPRNERIMNRTQGESTVSLSSSFNASSTGTPNKESIITFQDGHSYRLGIPTPRRTPYANRTELNTPLSTSLGATDTLTEEEKQKQLILRIADDIYEEEVKPHKNDTNLRSSFRNQRTPSSVHRPVHHSPSEIIRILDEHGLLYVDLRVPNGLLSAKPSLHLPGSVRRQRIGTTTVLNRSGQIIGSATSSPNGNSTNLATPVSNRFQARVVPSSDNVESTSVSRFSNRLPSILVGSEDHSQTPGTASHSTTPSLTITDNTFTPSTVPFSQRIEPSSLEDDTMNPPTVTDPSTNIAMLEYPLNCPSRIDTTVLFEDLVRTLADDLEKINRSTRNDVSYLSAKITAARNATDTQAIVVRDSKAALTRAENRIVETLDAKRAVAAKLNEIVTNNSNNPSTVSIPVVPSTDTSDNNGGSSPSVTTPSKGAVSIRSPGTASRPTNSKTVASSTTSNEAMVTAAIKRYSSVLASLDEQVHEASTAWKRAVWEYTMEVTKLDELKGARDALMSSLVEVTTMGTVTKEGLLNRTYKTLINLWKAQQNQQ